MAQFKSPTGEDITGTLEQVRGRAHIIGIDPETGLPEHSGGTEIFWDEMKSVERDGKILFLDEAGDEWTFDQLVRSED